MTHTDLWMVFKNPLAIYTPEHYWDPIELFFFLAYFHDTDAMESVSMEICIVDLFSHKTSQGG